MTKNKHRGGLSDLDHDALKRIFFRASILELRSLKRSVEVQIEIEEAVLLERKLEKEKLKNKKESEE